MTLFILSCLSHDIYSYEHAAFGGKISKRSFHYLRTACDGNLPVAVEAVGGHFCGFRFDSLRSRSRSPPRSPPRSRRNETHMNKPFSRKLYAPGFLHTLQCITSTHTGLSFILEMPCEDVLKLGENEVCR